MAGRGSEIRAKSAQSLVRMDQDLAVRVRSAAKAAGLSDAAWFRKIAVKATNASKALSAPTQRPHLPPEDVAELARLTASVARLNGALVQLQIAFREFGMTDLHSSGERVLSDLRSIQASLVDATIMVRDAFRRDPR